MFILLSLILRLHYLNIQQQCGLQSHRGQGKGCKLKEVLVGY